jgi:formylglycine-generating enzyme required for sulfatase activity
MYKKSILVLFTCFSFFACEKESSVPAEEKINLEFVSVEGGAFEMGGWYWL